MRIKCYIYPIITIIVWIFTLPYRFVDIVILGYFDQIEEGKSPKYSYDKERMFLGSHPFIKALVQIFLVIHTFVSATRGIFYGASFFVFEEKICRKMPLKNINTNEINSKSLVSDYSRISEKNEEKHDMEENNGNENIELNTNKVNND